jgi:hypothetical protein
MKNFNKKEKSKSKFEKFTEFIITKDSATERLVSTIGGIALLSASIFLYMNGFQNNWILGMGFWGALKLV